jgi:hypothetical protein
MLLNKQIRNILFFLLLTTASVFSQTELDTNKTVQITDTLFVMQKSPWGAVLRSAVLPGFGQYYNESYWKIPVVWGVLGYFTSIWINQNNFYHDYRKRYAFSITENNVNGDSQLKSNRDFYRNQRDEFAVYIGLSYFLNLVDAYVDAHLFDFDVSVDTYTKQPQLNIRFPLK